MKRRHRITNQAGFALVDVLVAVAVAGLAGSVLVGFVAFLERNNVEITRRIREHEETLAVERVLRILLMGAPPFVPGATSRSGIAGNESEFTVISIGPPVLGLPQAVPFSLHTEARGSALDVMLVWVDEKGQEQRELIAQGAFELSLAYLPLSARLSASSWQSRWRAEDGPLRAIRVAIRFAKAAASPEVVIPIQADLPASCLRKPRQIGCTAEGLGR